MYSAKSRYRVKNINKCRDCPIAFSIQGIQVTSSLGSIILWSQTMVQIITFLCQGQTYATCFVDSEPYQNWFLSTTIYSANYQSQNFILLGSVAIPTMQFEQRNSIPADQGPRSKTNHSQAPATHRRPSNEHDASEVTSIVPGAMGPTSAQHITPTPQVPTR